MIKETLLIEVGCEELPPRALKTLANAFKEALTKELTTKKLSYGEVKTFATPRRLALQIHQLQARQEDYQNERRGPALKVALKEGKPTPALEGFARSCGASIEELSILETEKGAWYTFTQRIEGQSLVTMLPEMVEQALKSLPIPKRMRWADNDFEFVRPVRWITALYGDQIVPMRLFNIEASNQTYGHRFHTSAPLTLKHADEYEQLLEEQGYIIPSFKKRRALIEEQIQSATEAYGSAHIKPALLDEVTALVEWPVTLVGRFEERFLSVPQEALIIAMEDHQRYFPILDHDGNLLNKFCFVSNIESNEPAAVIDGNERVIRPRFADAEFFWEEDLKINLEAYLEPLASVIFQTKLGTQADKIKRVAKLADLIAPKLGADQNLVARAARLNKADLISNMVQEFPELQGTMARYYALEQGENPTVADTLEQVYWPRFAGDKLPTTKEAQTLSIAERIDTIVGIFSIGEIPTGSRDPYSLRRNALAVLRILIEEEHSLDLYATIEAAAALMPIEINADKSIDLIFNYIFERMRAYSSDLGISADIFNSIAQIKLHNPLDIYTRLQAVKDFKELPEAEVLVQSDRRIRHILERNQKEESTTINPDLFENSSERMLYEAIQQSKSAVEKAQAANDYRANLHALVALAEPLGTFFEETMVMVDDQSLRNNRFALLAEAGRLMMSVADISQLQLEG